MVGKIQIIKRYFRSFFDLRSSQEDESVTDKEIREGVIFEEKMYGFWLLRFSFLALV